ncbi:MAG: nucleotidyltransferase family protein, partial [Gemmatimonadaceae bacterium]
MNRGSVALLLRALRLRHDDTPALPDVMSVSEWNTANLEGLLPLLAFEGAQLWLYRRIQQLKLPVPDSLKSELRAAVTRSAVINMRIDEQTVVVTTLLRKHGIAYSLLKGQARRAAAILYPFADARTVSDVDLLVPEPDADRA